MEVIIKYAHWLQQNLSIGKLKIIIKFLFLDFGVFFFQNYVHLLNSKIKGDKYTYLCPALSVEAHNKVINTWLYMYKIDQYILDMKSIKLSLT